MRVERAYILNKLIAQTTLEASRAKCGCTHSHEFEFGAELKCHGAVRVLVSGLITKTGDAPKKAQLHRLQIFFILSIL
jgi:hypothetical protein